MPSERESFKVYFLQIAGGFVTSLISYNAMQLGIIDKS